MEQDTKGSKLLASETPNKYDMTQMKELKKSLEWSVEQKEIPQIFSIGGNKELNRALFLKRQQKLQDIQSRNLIECDGLGKYYVLQGEENVVALKNITLKGDNKEGAIKKGQFVIIRGPSGGGKTTFLNLVGTIDKSTSGTLWIEGQKIEQSNKDSQMSKLRRDKIGIVFQTFNLLALMTAYENIELPMRIKGSLKDFHAFEASGIIVKSGASTELAFRRGATKSVVMSLPSAIARSLANSPAIVLLDEPTGDLDSKSTVQIMNLILQINNFGYGKIEERTTIIMVTHNEDLECYGDRIIFFEDGKIRKQVFNQYQFALDPEEYSKYLNNKI